MVIGTAQEITFVLKDVSYWHFRLVFVDLSFLLKDSLNRNGYSNEGQFNIALLLREIQTGSKLELILLRCSFSLGIGYYCWSHFAFMANRTYSANKTILCMPKTTSIWDKMCICHLNLLMNLPKRKSVSFSFHQNSFKDWKYDFGVDLSTKNVDTIFEFTVVYSLPYTKLKIINGLSRQMTL